MMADDDVIRRLQREADFESVFIPRLIARYKGRGCWWRNSIGWSDVHRDPFGGRGAGDWIGILCGHWVELELKARRGSQGTLQKVRAELVRSLGGLYLLVWEHKVKQVFETLDAIDRTY
jgi:hypothetical protein